MQKIVIHLYLIHNTFDLPMITCQKLLPARHLSSRADISLIFQKELTTVYGVSGISYIIAIMEFFCKISADSKFKLKGMIKRKTQSRATPACIT